MLSSYMRKIRKYYAEEYSAKVAKPDIEASNGVIHVIDNVILPPAK